MHHSRSLLVALISLGLASSAFASRVSSPHAPKTDALTPVATKIVNPSMLPRDFHRRVVKVEFSLVEQGQPKDVKVRSTVDDDVKTQVARVFKEWRFEVAGLGTDFQRKRFVLPLDIIPEA